MRINFYPIRQFQGEAAAAGLGAAGPIGAAIAGADLAIGIVQAVSGGAKAKRALRKRRAYQTPEEIFKILNATESRAAGGYDPQTLEYISSGADNALSSSLSAATRLGADPNALSQLLDQRIQSTFRLGAENQLQNMKNFSAYTGALGLVAENKAAEQKSQQDIIKDELQSASAMQQQGGQRIDQGLSTGLAVASAYGTANLYRERTGASTITGGVGGGLNFTPTPRSGAPPAVNQIQIGGVAPQPNYTIEEIMKLLTQGKLIGQ